MYALINSTPKNVKQLEKDRVISSSKEDTSVASKGSTSGSKPNVVNLSSGRGSNEQSHEHSWKPVYKTVNHPEQGHNEQYVIKEAWSEQKPIMEMVERDFCSGCHQDLTDWSYDNRVNHMTAHMDAGVNSGFYTKAIYMQTGTETINHPAEYGTRTITVQEGYYKTVVTGQKCSGCGATK